MTSPVPAAPSRSRLRRFFSFVLFRFLPALLILGTVWTAFQVAGALSRQVSAYNELQSRREAYSATATAIALAGDTGIQQNAPAQPPADDVRLVQFVTNTPMNSDSAAATATPVAAPAVPTAAPLEATPLPPAQSTAITQPTIIPPLAQPSLTELDGTAVPTQVPLIPRDYELVNIMILGSDEEITADNTIRTDTMVIVSINTQTRTVAMFSLPRDLWVYTPTPTMTRLNTVFGIGENFGWQGGGWELLRQTIFYNFGINVHYYARINFTGFEAIVDALGGIELAVDCQYEDYYPIAPLDQLDLTRPIEENYKLRTLPVGFYSFNGFDALWYARTRRATDDFDRNDRQQRVIRAVFRKALQTGQLAQLPELWTQFTGVVETNVPFELMLGILPIALNLNPEAIETFTLIRTYHTTPWQPPTGPFAGQSVQLPVYEPIRQLLTDFYTPPTGSQLNRALPPIAVYNGSPNPDWDKVAAGRLRDEGFNAYAAGAADNAAYTDTLLLDNAALDKDSLADDIADLLNITPAHITVQPDPNRQADYRVIVGANYNSCSAPGLGN